MTIENKLKELNIELPNAPDPVGAYVAFKKIGNLLFISGQLPISKDGEIIREARNLAFNIVLEDHDLRSIEYQKIKKELLNRYSSMLEFIDIG